MFERVYIYVLHTFGCLHSRMCKGNKKIKELDARIKKGMDQLHDDFNIKNFITQIRNNRLATIQNKQSAEINAKLALGNFISTQK